jgi:hypothetical protein
MTAPVKPKKSSVQRGAAYAEGGSTRMLKQQAAGPMKAGQTGKQPNPAPGERAASGGSRTSSAPSLAVPAKAGRTAPATKGR